MLRLKMLSCFLFRGKKGVTAAIKDRNQVFINKPFNFPLAKGIYVH